MGRVVQELAAGDRQVEPAVAVPVTPGGDLGAAVARRLGVRAPRPGRQGAVDEGAVSLVHQEPVDGVGRDVGVQVAVGVEVRGGHRVGVQAREQGRDSAGFGHVDEGAVALVAPQAARPRRAAAAGDAAGDEDVREGVAIGVEEADPHPVAVAAGDGVGEPGLGPHLREHHRAVGGPLGSGHGRWREAEPAGVAEVQVGPQVGRREGRWRRRHRRAGVRGGRSVAVAGGRVSAVDDRGWR